MRFSHISSDGTAHFFHPPSDHHGIQVTGSFNGWRTPGIPLQRSHDGWRASVPGLARGEHHYKLVTDGQWIPDPANMLRSGDGNSVLHHGGGPGMLVHLSFFSPALGESRPYVLFLPPGYFSSDARYSTLYLLHGALDWEKSWAERGELVGTLGALRSQGRIGEFLVVMPRDNGDLYKGDTRIYDYLARDLVGHIDHDFRTIASARHRGLDGLSTGGFTSIVVGAARSDVFLSVGSMSGSHARRSFEVVQQHADLARERGQRFRILCGQQEPHLGTSRELAAFIGSRGISVELSDPPGTHDWPLWRAALGDALQFHWHSFQR